MDPATWAAMTAIFGEAAAAEAMATAGSAVAADTAAMASAAAAPAALEAGIGIGAGTMGTLGAGLGVDALTAGALTPEVLSAYGALAPMTTPEAIMAAEAGQGLGASTMTQTFPWDKALKYGTYAAGMMGGDGGQAKAPSGGSPPRGGQVKETVPFDYGVPTLKPMSAEEIMRRRRMMRRGY